MTYMLNKALKMKKPGDPDLYAPGQPCKCKCNKGCIGLGRKEYKLVRTGCTQFAKNKPHELLKAGMVGGTSIIFCRYAEIGKSQIRSYKYRDPKTFASIAGFNANSLYLYCSEQKMPCRKEEYVEISHPQDPRVIRDLCDKVLMGELFGFLQVDIHFPDELLEKFSEFTLLFIVNEVPKEQIPQRMGDYQERTGRKTIIGTKKFLGVTRAKGILLYTRIHHVKFLAFHGN